MDTKQRIIKAALQLFLQKGYDKTSLNEIAYETGITKGGIYHYFVSKEQLFQEVLSWITRQMGEWSRSYFQSCDSIKDLLRFLFGSIKTMNDTFTSIVGDKESQSPYSFLEILIYAIRNDNDIRKKMESIYSHTRKNIKNQLLQAQKKGEIRSDIDCEILSFEINALIEGTILLSMLDESVDLETIGERLYQNIWKMISK